jgi:uncharacterized membrane protein
VPAGVILYLEFELCRGGGKLTRIEKSIEINAPPEKVWSFINWDNVPKYYESVKKVEWTSKEHNRVGATLHFTSELAGVKGEADAEITEWTENKKASWRTITGNPTMIFTAALDPTEAGTKMTFAADYEMPYSILGKIIDKLRVHKAMEKDNENALKKLKVMAEA